MRRNKQDGASGGFGGDWSESGTFLRKPASGWLHEDTELMDNSCINYEVEVFWKHTQLEGAHYVLERAIGGDRSWFCRSTALSVACRKQIFEPIAVHIERVWINCLLLGELNWDKHLFLGWMYRVNTSQRSYNYAFCRKPRSLERSMCHLRGIWLHGRVWRW